MRRPDIVSFESIEKFIQTVEWGKINLPKEVVSIIKRLNSFKTDSLDGSLSNYLVSLGGNLKSQHFEQYEYLGNDEVSQEMSINKKGEYWMDEDFQGSITISPRTDIDVIDKDWSVVFELSFFDGVLQKACCISAKSANNKARKKQAKATKDKFDRTAKTRDKPMCSIFFINYIKYYAFPVTSFCTKAIAKHPKFKKIIRILLNTFVPFNKYF
jgi:hypothetical protein